MNAELAHETLMRLPTRRDEAWRYADLGAVETLWPLAAPEAITVSAGEDFARAVVHDGGVWRAAITLAAGAKAALHVLNAGAGYGRVELAITLGEGAEFTLGGVQLVGGKDVREIVTEVIHAAPDAVSRQVVRSVAGGSGTANYLGKVKVTPGADGTDGAQSVRAMLLTPTATANAKPELEIHADDVKCAHGCAVGELDAMGLFYLASRGLAPAEARALMLRAFIAEGFAGAEDEDALLERAVAGLGALLEDAA